MAGLPAPICANDRAREAHVDGRDRAVPRRREMLTKLAATWPLMLITKGDLLHQTSKLERSGLRERFRFVEVVSHKTPDVYAAILSRHGVDPNRFLMIGNSLRSDILPVVDAGGWAVHIPAALSWSHEHADMPPHAKGRYCRSGGARIDAGRHRDDR